MPQPTNIGGGLMGYPTSVDNGLIAPFTLEDPDVTVLTSGLSITSQSAYFCPVVLYGPAIIAQMRCNITAASPTGNVDMGIYDSTGTNRAPGNLLGHTGAIAATTGNFTQNLTSNLLLSPGAYWLAFLDTVGTDQPAQRDGIAAGIGALYKTSAANLTVLPSVAGTVADTAVRIGLMALLSGSFS